ncbi:hypothetical protein M422DRAFT_33484, partial [Sphaerobolus stellatus SS14]
MPVASFPKRFVRFGSVSFQSFGRISTCIRREREEFGGSTFQDFWSGEFCFLRVRRIMLLLVT